MITDSFDPKSLPVISPADCYGPGGQVCDVCLVTFSREIMNHVLSAFPCRKEAELLACNGSVPLYTFLWQGLTLGIYLSHVGSALAGTDVIDAAHLLGARRFVVFGSAGSLQREKTRGRYVVPTEAYRDEGMSYHYAPPSDYIPLPGSALVSEVLSRLEVPHVAGRVWTTDAFYRETRDQMARRVREGCLAVDMELSGLQAVCDFHGFRLYAFLETGDVLDGAEYDHSGLHAANHSLGKLDLALALAEAAAKGENAL